MGRTLLPEYTAPSRVQVTRNGRPPEVSSIGAAPDPG
ncbi:uncharacterized protein METZ01_LOCUS338445 [marine metagenome]|uniref:Uncharacterized protein n=1 Tax=marine metagenome TaxID=408172 RepID=A0A382QMN4_9ZZZZ